MSTNLEVQNLTTSLRRMADNIQHDADRLRDIAEKIDATRAEYPDAKPADFPVVLDIVFSALNNSSVIGTAQSIASSMSKGA